MRFILAAKMETRVVSGIRNIGILAHVDAGKTSITERILHVSGLKDKPGDVDDGTTVTDYLGVERRHGITVKAAAVHFTWQNTLFHLIDTPGHVDFGAEVQRTLRVLDGAVVAVCAVSGVQSRTEVLVKACRERPLSRIYFVNKMDRKGADFFRVVADIRSSLGENALAIHVPIFIAGEWRGVVDLIEMVWYEYSVRDEERIGQNSDGAEYSKLSVPISNMPRPLSLSGLPDDILTQVQSSRETLVIALSENDPELLEAYVGGRLIDADMLRSAVRKASLERDAVLVLCGSAFADISAHLLLDAVIDYLPSPEIAGCPEGIDPRTGERIQFAPLPDAPFSAFVFKTMGYDSDDTIAWTRIWSGSLVPGRKVYDARTGHDVIVKRIHGLHADKIESVERALAGSIVGLTLLPPIAGASLCERSSPILYEKLEILQPVVSAVMEPASAQDISVVRQALESLALEDTSLIVKAEPETGRFEVSGQGELHLIIVVERLLREYGVRVRMGNPQVSFRETPKTAGHRTESFDHDFGGARIRLKIGVSLNPVESGSGNSVEISPDIRIQGAARQIILSSIESALAVGPREGWPVVDTSVVVDEYEPPQASGRNAEIAIGAAAAVATRNILLAVGSNVLEPEMQIDLECPEQFFGAVLSLIKSRSGRIEAVEEGAAVQLITAMAPMRMLFGFADELRTVSKGMVSYQAKFAGYAKMIGK
jgi:elongation factor G